MNSTVTSHCEPDVDVVALRPMRGYRLWLKFADGNEGVADLSGLPRGKKFRTPWRSMREFKKVVLRHRTASWDTSDGNSIEFSPFTLYVEAGLATWDVFMEPRGEDRPRTLALEDHGNDTLWVELDNGGKGYFKPLRDIAGGMERFALSDRPKGQSFIAPCGNIVWKNEFWVSSRDIAKILAGKSENMQA